MAEDHTSADAARDNLNVPVDRLQTNAEAARGDFGKDGAVNTADRTAHPVIPDADSAGVRNVADEIAELLRDHAQRDFDLGSLDADRAEAVRRATSTLRVRISTARANIIEIGLLLIEVESLLPHGQFGPWLEAEFGFHRRTAERWMAAARVMSSANTTACRKWILRTRTKRRANPGPQNMRPWTGATTSRM